MSQIPRLFVEEQLSAGLDVELEGAQAHYLLHVLRLKPGAPVDLLDDRTGEWRCEVTEAARKRIRLGVREHRLPREQAPDLWLCAAPLKRQRFEWVIEKATELGVRRIVPVLTRRTVAERINADRLRAHMIEAAEQCARTALPELAEAVALPVLAGSWDPARTLIFADEEGGVDMTRISASLPAAILIGPEGGFDPAEREILLKLENVRRLSLGPRILRADTAAVAAVAQFQLVTR